MEPEKVRPFLFPQCFGKSEKVEIGILELKLGNFILVFWNEYN